MNALQLPPQFRIEANLVQIITALQTQPKSSRGSCELFKRRATAGLIPRPQARIPPLAVRSTSKALTTLKALSPIGSIQFIFNVPPGWG